MKRIAYLALLLLLAACAAAVEDKDGASVTQPIYTKADMGEMAYLFSYDYDKCGHFSSGETVRQAIVAKIVECPFTPAAKEEFYRDVRDQSENFYVSSMTFLASHSFAEFQAKAKVNASCDRPDAKAAMTLVEDRIALYKAGKIKLTDILINVKDHPGEVIDCAEFAKDFCCL